jgi:hypothetical protein
MHMGDSLLVRRDLSNRSDRFDGSTDRGQTISNANQLLFLRTDLDCSHRGRICLGWSRRGAGGSFHRCLRRAGHPIPAAVSVTGDEHGSHRDQEE